MWPYWVHSSQWLDVFLHHLWGQQWWVLTNLIDFLILLFLLEVYLFHPWPTDSASLLLGMAFVILVQMFLYLLSFLSEVSFQWKFHVVQTGSHIPLVVLYALFQYVALAYDGVVWKCLALPSLLSFFVVILCLVGASRFSVICAISSMVGSRWPSYSPFLN